MKGTKKLKQEDTAPLKTKKTASRHKKIFFKVFGVAVQVVLVFIIVGLFSLPTVYYVLPEAETVEDSHDTTNLSDPDICSKGTTLSDKDICRNEMMPLHNCLSGDGSEIIVPFTSNLQRSKQDLRALVGGLPLLQPSPACEARVKPFLCLHVFGLCDSSGKYHTSLRRECTEIRDNICAKEWRKAVDLLGDDALPVCEDLPDVTEECVMEDDPTTTLAYNATTDTTAPPEKPRLECRGMFFFNERETLKCRPECGEFQPTPHSELIPQMTALCLCYISSIAIFIVAFTVQRTMLEFPQVLHVYLGITSFFISSVALIGFIDNKSLYCANQDLIYSLGEGNATAFCTISGITFTYGLLQACVWGILVVFFDYFRTAFIGQYRQLLPKIYTDSLSPGRLEHNKKANSKRLRVNITCVLLGVFVPLPFALAHLKDGFVATTNPTIFCIGRNGDTVFYTLVLPISIFMAAGTCMMTLLFCHIIKLAYAEMQEKGVSLIQAVKFLWVNIKLDIRLSFIASYYICVGVAGLVSLTYYGANSNLDIRTVTEHFLCKTIADVDCPVDFIEISNIRIFSVVVAVMVAMLPVVTLLFTIEPQQWCDCKKKSSPRKESKA